MKTRWYSRNCYVKRIPSVRDLNEWGTSLCSLNPISAGELVASFENENEIHTAAKHRDPTAQKHKQLIFFL